MRILVVDNYDSFVFNLVQYLGELGESPTVLRNNAPELDDPANALDNYDAVLISPGPGNPDEAGQTLNIIKAAAESNTPLFGVCLGHQAIAQYFGADVIRASEIFHGKTSDITHGQVGVLENLPDPLTVTRYHSLTVDPETLPDELEVTAESDSGMIMALRHRELPIHSVQFHPESVMTRGGHRMLANWLALAGEIPNDELLEALEQRYEQAYAPAHSSENQ